MTKRENLRLEGGGTAGGFLSSTGVTDEFSFLSEEGTLLSGLIDEFSFVSAVNRDLLFQICIHRIEAQLNKSTRYRIPVGPSLTRAELL